MLAVISIAYLENGDLFRFGGCIARAARKSGRRAALITSGDLSHVLADDGPYGYNPSGPVFDDHVLACIKTGDTQKLLNTDDSLLERAAQCGFYGLLMTYGAMDEIHGEGTAGLQPGRVLSYEGTFGVGYLIARLSDI